MKNVMQAKKGFTLIELLVVIAIIGILAVFTLAFLAPAREKGRDAKRKEDLNAVAKALELFYSDQNVYPDAADVTLDFGGFDNLGGDLIPTYIPAMPDDPVVANRGTANDYKYASGDATGQGYILESILENDNDPQDSPAAGDQFRLCGGSYTTDCSK